jgi:hypothetical protein
MEIFVFIRKWVFCFVGIYLSLYSQDLIDENKIFSDSSLIFDTTKLVTAAQLNANAESTSVKFSGQVTTSVDVLLNRKLNEKLEKKYIEPEAAITGNAYFDIRLPLSIKSFCDVELRYPGKSEPQSFQLSSRDTFFWIREFFMDINIAQRIYIRSGKQLLKWGRCSFWNPTDLVNVDRPSFIEKIGSRDGTFGIRTHVPFGTTVNLYTFLDLNRIASAEQATVDSTSGIAKAEFVFNGIETSISMWKRPKIKPIFGWDISTTILNIDLNAELSIAKGSYYPILLASGSKDTNNWMPRVSVSLNKSFGLLNVPDRVNILCEVYYNGAGVKENYFRKIADLAGGDFSAATLSSDFVEEWGKYIKAYEPNSFSRFYAAFFSSFSKFMLRDLTLSCNALANLDQKCVIFTGELDYRNSHNFSFGMSATMFLGEPNTEYTFQTTGTMIRFISAILF